MGKKICRISAVVLIACMLAAMCSSLIACQPTDGKESEILTVRDIVLDTTNAKTEFAYGEEFTAEGLKVTAVLSDDSERDVPLEKCRLSKVRNTPGKRKVSVTYAKKTKRYEVVFADKPMPPISDEVKLEIAGVKTDGAYRVQAEDIDLAISGVTAVGGELVVSDDGADGGKYIANYGNTENYFGFTFSSDAAYDDVTLDVRLANPSTEHVMQPGSNIMMYLNYAGTTDNGSLGITRSAAVAKSDADALAWRDFVVRGLKIKEGINTLTFGVLDPVVPCIDYIDFYVGKPFSTSSVDVAAAGESTVVQFEDMGLEKITTRDDYLAAYDLEQGEICVLNDTPASGGKAVFALQQGEVSTVINAETDSTVQLILSAACNVNIDWAFAKDAEIILDGQALKINEHNIRDQSQENVYLWKDSSLGFCNLSAGEHLLDIKINNPHASFDALTVKTVSAGEFTEKKPELYIDGAGTFVMEGEHLDPSGVVVRDDYAELVIGQPYGAYNVVNNTDASGRRAIDGFTGKPKDGEMTKFTVDLYCGDDVTLLVYARAASNLGVNFTYRSQVIARMDDKICAPDRCNLAAGWVSEDEYDWQKVKLLKRDVSAGAHKFEFDVVDFLFTLDCFEFEVVSYGSYASDAVLDGVGEYYVEAENLDPTGVVAREDFVEAGRILSARDEYCIDATADPHGGQNISGLKEGSTVTSDFYVEEKSRIKIYIGAKANLDLGVSVFEKTHLLFSVDGQEPKRPPEQPALNSNKFDETTSGWVESLVGLWTLDAGLHTFKINIVGFPIELDYIKYDVIACGEDANYDFVIDGIGDYYVEAEELDPTGAIADTGFVNAGRVWNATDEFCIERDASARGGFDICGLTTGSKLTTKFKLEDDASLRIYLACKSGMGINLSEPSHAKFYIDGVQVPCCDRNVLNLDGDNVWVERMAVHSKRLEKGEHTFTVEMLMTWNFDYIRFSTLGYGKNGNDKFNDITFTQNGETVFEAEYIDDCDVKLEDGSSVSDGYKVPVSTDLWFSCSNLNYVKGLTTGTVLNINFSMEGSATVKLSALIKAGIPVQIFNGDHVKFYLDGERITPPNTGDLTSDFTEHEIFTASLGKGEHTFKIEMTPFAFDMDCFKFAVTDYTAA